MNKSRGEGYVPICIMVVILCMLLLVFVSFASAVNVIRQTERNARVALDSIVTTNSIVIYDSIKTGSDYTEVIDSSDYIRTFSSLNSLDFSGDLLYRYDDSGNELYRVTLPIISFVQDKHLKIKADFEVIVPLYFAGVRVSTATVPITVISRLDEKF